MVFDFSIIDDKDKITIHCPEKSIARSFLEAFNKEYPRHHFMPMPKNDCWDAYKEETCYFPNFHASFRNMQYGDIRNALQDGYEIISVFDIYKTKELPISLSEVDIKSLFGME